jgi:molecular chaperone GrpE
MSKDKNNLETTTDTEETMEMNDPIQSDKENQESTENLVDNTIQEEDNDAVSETEEAKTEETVEDPLLKTQKELAELRDKYLRNVAEFDNYRKRTIKEKQEIIKLAAKDTVVALLPAMDDFDRVAKHATEADEKIPDGVSLIINKLLKSFEQLGVKKMESDGQDFDPELHEALTKIPAPSKKLRGKVIETIESGYYLNDKIIRYAKVVVGE